MSAELLRICTAPGGAPVLDLADGTVFSYAPDSLQIDPGGQAGQSSALDERYGGSRVDWDARANGTISWRQIILRDAPGGAANLTAELERADPPMSRFVEWRRAGQTSSLWYERRGPAAWKEVERWDTGDIALLDVSMPVGPAAFGAPLSVSPASQQLPAVFDVPSVPGSLWAPLAVTSVLPVLSARLAWALIAPYQGDFGVREAEAFSPHTGNWTGVTANGGARSGNVLQVAAVAPATYYELSWSFSGATLNDAEMEQDVTLEVWIRLLYDPSLVIAPILSLRAAPAGVGASRYSLDFGSSGRQIGPPTTGQAWFLHRAGVLKLSTDAPFWQIAVGIQTGAVASGILYADYALFAPGRWRACSPTGLPNDAAYPAFQPDLTTSVTKRVNHDLSGQIAHSTDPLHADTGLSGAPLFVPPGASKVLLAASPAVPDDVTATATGDVIGPVLAVAPTLTVTPRYRLLETP